MEQQGVDEMVPLVIDMDEWRATEMDESAFTRMLHKTRYMMNALLGGWDIPLKVKGNPRDVKAFAKAANKEARYFAAYKKHGLNDPRTYRNKAHLDKAVGGFERKTGLKWPFK